MKDSWPLETELGSPDHFSWLSCCWHLSRALPFGNNRTMCAILKYLGFVSFCSHGEDLLKIPGLQNSSNNSKTKCWKHIFLNAYSNKNSTSLGPWASQESTAQLHNFSSFFFPILRFSVGEERVEKEHSYLERKVLPMQSVSQWDTPCQRLWDLLQKMWQVQDKRVPNWFIPLLRHFHFHFLLLHALLVFQ